MEEFKIYTVSDGDIEYLRKYEKNVYSNKINHRTHQKVFVRKNQAKIYNNAKLLYKQKLSNDLSAGYVKSTLDYKYLEFLCDNFTNNVSL